VLILADKFSEYKWMESGTHANIITGCVCEICYVVCCSSMGDQLCTWPYI
jgi:hypothetical protein